LSKALLALLMTSPAALADLPPPPSTISVELGGKGLSLGITGEHDFLPWLGVGLTAGAFPCWYGVPAPADDLCPRGNGGMQLVLSPHLSLRPFHDVPAVNLAVGAAWLTGSNSPFPSWEWRSDFGRPTASGTRSSC
jgi:hypothetical protein